MLPSSLSSVRVKLSTTTVARPNIVTNAPLLSGTGSRAPCVHPVTASASGSRIDAVTVISDRNIAAPGTACQRPEGQKDVTNAFPIFDKRVHPGTRVTRRRAVVWNGNSTARIRNRKVEMMVPRTPRIETGAAMRASVSAHQIFVDRQLGAACATENCRRVEGLGRPRRQVVIRKCIMTLLACVISAAAKKFDRDDVEHAVIVRTACLRVHVHAADPRAASPIRSTVVSDSSHAYISNGKCARLLAGVSPQDAGSASTEVIVRTSWSPVNGFWTNACVDVTSRLRSTASSVYPDVNTMRDSGRLSARARAKSPPFILGIMRSVTTTVISPS